MSLLKTKSKTHHTELANTLVAPKIGEPGCESAAPNGRDKIIPKSECSHGFPLADSYYVASQELVPPADTVKHQP